MSKKPLTQKEKVRAPSILSVPQASDETPNEALSRAAMRPAVHAAKTLAYYSPFGELSLDALVDGLTEQCALAHDGNLSRTEAIYVTQAETLNAMFHKLARRANNVEYVDQFETYIRLSLKAQAQCRVTLEALAALKRPAVVIAKQENIAHGPQQVNIAYQTGLEAPKSAQSKLLESSLEAKKQWLDCRSTTQAGSSDSALAALVAVNRPSNGDREGEVE